MSTPSSVAELHAKQTQLQKDYQKAKEVRQLATKLFAKKKAALIEFNNKYGRVIQMMSED